ncbi:MAG: 30S ribosomal protein S13 [Candidatus Margulisiibacteriota bacterium]|nr:30S ribosomal protein S13 [Candidatus Margulisiibacteriota bacterium]
MARLAGVDLPANKRIEIGLTYIYGIGRSLSKVILDKIGVDGSIKVKDLSESDVVKLRDALKQVVVEGDLRKEVSMDIKRLIDIGAYRGIRHKKGLPARGQRTRTNGRTRRGKRKTVGRGKKEEK